MANPKLAMESLIEENGGKLIRQKKHKVYQFPNGSTFIVAKTPDCPFAYDNALAHLKRLLGIYPPDRGAPGTRRNKRLKQKISSGSIMLPFENVQKAETWKDKLGMIQIPAPAPKPVIRKSTRPPTFEERMLRAGVKKLEGRKFDGEPNK